MLPIYNWTMKMNNYTSHKNSNVMKINDLSHVFAFLGVIKNHFDDNDTYKIIK